MSRRLELGRSGQKVRHRDQARAVVGDMPELSRFLGIVISMHYDDHAPPHFHVCYAGRKATLRSDLSSS